MQTVFGTGSSYLFTRIILTLIIFSHDYLEQPTVERFKSLPTIFIGPTTQLVAQGRLFAAPLER